MKNVETQKLTDSLNRKLTVLKQPQRIVSLCPSITETLFAFGLNDRIVGVTRFCIEPQEALLKTKTGGTKDLKEGVINALFPDLIIAEKEENTPQMVAALEQKYPVFVTNVESFEDALDMIAQLGKLTDKEPEARGLIQEIENQWVSIPILTSKPRTAYAIWKNPYMVAGRNTYISSILSRCGLYNVFLDRPERYPAVTVEDLKVANLQILFLSSEPFPFSRKHIDELQTELPETKILLIDGKIMSWYGSRMIWAAQELKNILPKLLE